MSDPIVVIRLADLEALLDRKLSEHFGRPAQDLLLTLEQAAQRAQVHPKTLARYLRGDANPALAGRRIGNRWRISERALLNWMEANDGD